MITAVPTVTFCGSEGAWVLSNILHVGIVVQQTPRKKSSVFMYFLIPVGTLLRRSPAIASVVMMIMHECIQHYS